MASIFGTNKRDKLYGYDSLDDIIYGYGGNDMLSGLGGGDVLFGDDGSDALYGDAGNDFLYGGTGADFLSGGNENDYLYGGTGVDYLSAGNGNDSLSGGAGADYLSGGSGNDTALYLASSTGVVVSLAAGKGWLGDAQGDTLTDIENLEGSKYNDILVGDAQSNKLLGRYGNDALLGLDGDDVLNGGFGADTLYGGEGEDLATYADSSQGVFVHLQSGNGYYGDAQGDKLADIENLAGSSYNDILFGDAQDNVIYGGSGHDKLFGEGGDDTLFGGSGNDNLKGGDGHDLIIGGAGYDFLTGGADGDTFLFSVPGVGSGGQFNYLADIKDFNQSEGDKIQLQGANLTFIGDYAFGGQAGQVRYQNVSATETQVWGDLDGDAVADFTIRLVGEHELTLNDFIL